MNLKSIFPFWVDNQSCSLHALNNESASLIMLWFLDMFFSNDEKNILVMFIEPHDWIKFWFIIDIQT